MAQDTVLSGGQCTWLSCQDEAPTLPETWPRCGALAPARPGLASGAVMVAEARTLQRTQTQAVRGQGPPQANRRWAIAPQ